MVTPPFVAYLSRRTALLAIHDIIIEGDALGDGAGDEVFAEIMDCTGDFANFWHDICIALLLLMWSGDLGYGCRVNTSISRATNNHEARP